MSGLEEEHKEFAQRLWKNYIAVFLVGLIGFLSLLVYFNNLFTVGVVTFVKEEPDLRASLGLIIDHAQAVGESVVRVVQTRVGQNPSTLAESAFYCSSNMSDSQCLTLQKGDQNNVVTMDVDRTSTSFRCLTGSCSEVASLWDFLWTFRLRFGLIDYLLISYSVNEASSSLIVPSLAQKTVDFVANAVEGQWKIIYQKKALTLGRNYGGVVKVNITIIFDSQVLVGAYGIRLDNFDFARSDYPLLISTDQKYAFEHVAINMVILIILGCICWWIVWRAKVLLADWQATNFKDLLALDSLYKYQINSIFSGRKPHNSAILSDSAWSGFYEDLSEIMDESYESLSIREAEQQREESFKFLSLLDRIKFKFQELLRGRQDERIRVISELRPLIKSGVMQVTESVAQKLKEMCLRARQLHISRAFFYFGYMALLQSIPKYDERLREDSTPLPQQMIKIFRYMNQTINSQDIKFAFKFAFVFAQTIEEELIMKLQYNFHQRYYGCLKDLDVGMAFGKQLGLEQELKYLQESLQNKKHIFNTFFK